MMSKPSKTQMEKNSKNPYWVGYRAGVLAGEHRTYRRIINWAEEAQKNNKDANAQMALLMILVMIKGK